MIALIVSLLTGCYTDYTIAGGDEIIVSGSSAPDAPPVFPYSSADVPQEAPDSLDTGEYTDSDSSGASESVSTDTDSPPPAEDTDLPADTDVPTSEDTDEPTLPVDTGVEVDTEPPPPEPPPVEDTDVPADPVDTDTGTPVDTGEPPPPTPDPGPEWRTVYFEDFSDGLGQGWSPYNGGCGAQGVTGTPSSWTMTSDWNGARVPIEPLDNVHTRLTIQAQIGLGATNVVVRWLSNPVTWNSNDDGGFSFYYVAGFGPGLYLGGTLAASYATTPDVPLTLEIETDGYEYVASVDGVEVASGTTEGVASMGDGLEFHANGSCRSSLLSVQEVHIEVAD